MPDSEIPNQVNETPKSPPSKRRHIDPVVTGVPSPKPEVIDLDAVIANYQQSPSASMSSSRSCIPVFSRKPFDDYDDSYAVQQIRASKGKFGTKIKLS